MNKKLFGYLCLIGGIVLSLVALGLALSIFSALAEINSFDAVETAFGRFVLLILLMVTARKSWDRGRSIIKTRA
jgi:hypothetical protein